MMSSSYFPLQPQARIRRLIDEFRSDTAVLPQKLRELLLGPSISDLLINGTTGVYADRGGGVEHIRSQSRTRTTGCGQRLSASSGTTISWEKMLLPSFIPQLGWLDRPCVSNRGKKKLSVKAVFEIAYATDSPFSPDTIDTTYIISLLMDSSP